MLGADHIVGLLRAIREKTMIKLRAVGIKWPDIAKLASLSICGLLLLSPLSAQKMHLKPIRENLKPKKHPYTALLTQTQPKHEPGRKGNNYQKLLVILVDFALESPDDPNTTGNGKFQLEPDPSYLYTIAAPPHNREYFETNLQAMYWYYRAASNGTYNLEYDVWPKDKAAYTLPHPMAYYNPPDASSDLFVGKMEEYFKVAFETADADDPEIDFSKYGHYMIIHAGSDWQHDSYGDSPSDLPSFFIRVGDDKAAVVDSGNTRISYASNVPATISQDFDVSQEDGYSLHSGYGALNAVLFHEFGHSLGLVDLYNVRNFYPMVGSFDIMDSGGAGYLMDELEGGDLVLVEGALPALPGAFSRALLFEDELRASGSMIDIQEIDDSFEVVLDASSKLPGENNSPTIIKFSLNPSEYYLLENRSVDPDGDGGTALMGALDGRVILYPSPISATESYPTYEYDYLLPSFITSMNDAVGGGILAWHVNEKVIYEEGQTLDDGSWVSNYDNNTVNTNFNRPGVKVLEADGLRDIGEPYSSYWTGTAYEYFHAKKPILNDNGLFVQWSNDDWRPRLSATTDPAMLDSNNMGSSFYLDDISHPGAKMTFSLRSSYFDSMYKDIQAPVNLAGPPVSSTYSDLALPFIGELGLHLFNRMYEGWQDTTGPTESPAQSFDLPLISTKYEHPFYNGLYGVKGATMYHMSLSSAIPDITEINFPDTLSVVLNSGGVVYAATQNALYKVWTSSVLDSLATQGIRSIVVWPEKIGLLKSREFVLLNSSDFSVLNRIDLDEDFGSYDPVACYYDDAYSVFLTSDSGNLYEWDGERLRKLFTNTEDVKPSQPALYQMDGGPVMVFFGLGNRAYLMRSNGALEPSFPLYLDQRIIQEHGYSRALKVDNTVMLYLPVGGQGYIAISKDGQLKPEYAMLRPYQDSYSTLEKEDYLHYDAGNEALIWYYVAGNRVNILSRNSVAEDPILWNGRYNASGGSITASDEGMPPPDFTIRAYVYPNPVKTPLFRLRVSGSWESIKVRIWDIIGNLIYQNDRDSVSNPEEMEIDARSWSSGVYILNVSDAKHSKTVKFAVEK